MSKRRIVILAIITAFSVVILFQFQTAARLRRDLAAANDENARLRQGLTAHEQDSHSSSSQTGSNTDEKPGEPQQKRLQELESEVIRLRGVAGRAMRAEVEVAQLKSVLGSPQGPATTAAPDADSGANTFLAYLGEAVPLPPNIDPAYTKEGLVNAIQQAAQLAGVPLKKAEIETSEFPYLAGVVCDSDADFEKVKAQFKNMPGYEYGGATSSQGSYAFNMIPYRSYPPDAGQRIGRRTTLRMQMFFDRLTGR